MKNQMQVDPNLFTFGVKVIAEPRLMRWEAPKQSTGLGFLGVMASSASHVSNTPGIQLNTVSGDVFSTNVHGLNNDSEMLSNLSLHKALLYQFKDIFSDPDIEAGVEAFIKQKDLLYSEFQKKGSLSHEDLLKIEEGMEPYNLGYIYRVQMVVTIMRKSPFPGAKQGRDNVYRLVRKSKQAHMALDRNTGPEGLISELKAKYADEVSKVKVTDTGMRLYQIENVAREDGTYYKRLTTKDNDVVVSTSNHRD